ncbi:DUF6462 family protein [Pseudobutyrivibrio sp.]|uniref:DUF6462 family protein n=1 Tax=Pseudobutyrivibrio sp. TaxID=2014367 RepID=UPI001B654382|nr:DUF6462 family protein [Pseudobutyrivibrio sp.]MBP3261235.1 hypothetical protein [Pseudobutyrivibrio sp.]
MEKERTVIERKFVRYVTGADLYDMSQKSFEKLAKNAKATHKVGKMVLVNTVLVDKYLETCCRIVED